MKKDLKKIPLSEETKEKIQILFTPSTYFEVENLLVKECGANLLFPEHIETADEISMERIRFAVLKLSNGDIDGLRLAIETAKQDYRDVLVQSGFGEPEIHKNWKPES